jgi:hypothetical protein|tara:strand:- start:42 stop:257 length:216 start_codon:yes stop_codon:yes gene_type:complete
MSHDEDLFTMMVKFDERQRTIFNMLARVEKHLEKLNGKVSDHDTVIAKMQILGTIAVVSFPIIVNIIMRVL